jgi:hypothetical protein
VTEADWIHFDIGFGSVRGHPRIRLRYFLLVLSTPSYHLPSQGLLHFDAFNSPTCEFRSSIQNINQKTQWANQRMQLENYPSFIAIIIAFMTNVGIGQSVQEESIDCLTLVDSWESPISPHNYRPPRHSDTATQRQFPYGNEDLTTRQCDQQGDL